MEYDVIFPAQLLCMCFWIYALLHNRGMIAAVLNSTPAAAFGSLVYPVYLFHYYFGAYIVSDDKVWWNPKTPTAVHAYDIGAVVPVGGLAITFVFAWFVNEYFQGAVMNYVEPRARKLTSFIFSGCSSNDTATAQCPYQALPQD